MLHAFFSAHTPPDHRRALEAELLATRDAPGAWRWGLELLASQHAQTTTDPALQWLAAAAVESAVCRRWRSLMGADRDALARGAWACVIPPAPGVVPMAATKLGKALVETAKLRWPEEDPTFVDRLLRAAAVRRTSDAALEVLAVFFDEIFAERDASDEALRRHAEAAAPGAVTTLVALLRDALPRALGSIPVGGGDDERGAAARHCASVLNALVAALGNSNDVSVLVAVGRDGVEALFACVHGGIAAAAAHESDDAPSTDGMYRGALRCLVELLGGGCLPPSVGEPLLAAAADGLRGCCEALATAAAAAEEGGWGGDSPAYEDAAVAFLRSFSVVLSAQLPRLERLTNGYENLLPRLLASLLEATRALAEPRSFLAAGGAWRAVIEHADESSEMRSGYYEAGFGQLAELVVSRCFYCRGGGEGVQGGGGLFLAELDPSPGSGLGIEDGAVEAELTLSGGCRGDDEVFGLSHLIDESSRKDASESSERDVFRTGCTALLGRAADVCPAAVLSRVFPAFHSALERYGETAAAAAAGGRHPQALEATEDIVAALEALTRCAGGMSIGCTAGGGDAAAEAATAAVRALLESAPGLAQAARAASAGGDVGVGGGVIEDGAGASLVSEAAARIPPAVYAAVGACAPWATRWLGGGGGGHPGASASLLAAVLRAVLPPLRAAAHGVHDPALAPAAGALTAVIGVARPSPADLLGVPETGEALRLVPELVLSGVLPADEGGGDCLGALGGALLRRAPGEATDAAAAQMWEPRVGAFRDALAAPAISAALSGLERLRRGESTSAGSAGVKAAAALVRSAADAPAAPKRTAMAATVAPLLPTVAAALEHLAASDASSASDVAVVAAVVDASIAFLHAVVDASTAADVDAGALRRAVAALCELGGASVAGGSAGPRLVSLIAALLTRPGAHLAPLLSPVLSLTLGRWAMQTEGEHVSSGLAPELRGPLAVVHLAALRSRWSTFFPKAGTSAANAAAALIAADPNAAAVLAAAPRAILEHVRAVLSGAVPASPGALRALLDEMERCRMNAAFMFRTDVFVAARPSLVTAALGTIVGRHHESLGSELASLVHALASEDLDAFFGVVLPGFVASIPGLDDGQRGALVALVPATATDQPSMSRGLRRLARDASLYLRVNRAALE